jgi:hypothetical protein
MCSRPCLYGDRKQRNESSPAAAEVAHMIHGRGQSSCPMTIKPRAKEVLGSEDHLCEWNCPMAEPSGEWVAVAYLNDGEDVKMKGSFPRPVVFIGGGEREVWGGPLDSALATGVEPDR